jgi:hypothetical protein
VNLVTDASKSVGEFSGFGCRISMTSTDCDWMHGRDAEMQGDERRNPKSLGKHPVREDALTVDSRLGDGLQRDLS